METEATGGTHQTALLGCVAALARWKELFCALGDGTVNSNQTTAKNRNC